MRAALAASSASFSFVFVVAFAAFLLGACSGGGSPSAPPPAPPAGSLALFAGAVRESGNIDGQGNAARFEFPAAIAADPRTGMIYVADTGNWTIRQVTPGGLVSTLAGAPGQPGSADGAASAARLGTITALAVDANGVLYAADADNFSIRRIDADGRVTTWAGNGKRGTADGVGSGASFYNPTALAFDRFSNLYVGDEYVIRRISPAGVVTTVAGTFGRLGLADGPGQGALLGSTVFGLATDRVGNLFFLEAARLRKLSTDGIVTTVVDSEPRIILNPTGIAIDADDNLYVADSITHAITKISPAGQVLSPPVAGTGEAGVVDGPRASAMIREPALAMLPGKLVMAERLDNVIRQLDLASGQISTIAGIPAPLEFGSLVDGIGAAARFAQVNQLSADGLGNLYVDDNARLRRVTPSAQVSTISTAFVGSINALHADAAGSLYIAQGLFCSVPAAHSQFPCGMKLHAMAPGGATTLLREFSEPILPSALARDTAGTLYVAVRGASQDQVLRILADGSVSVFWQGTARGLAVDPAGAVYASDPSNHVIVRIAPGGQSTVIAGKSGESGDNDGAAQDARFNAPAGIAVDSAGSVYVADTLNNLVRKVTSQGVVSTVAGTRRSRGFAPGPLPGILKTPVAVAVVGTDLHIAMPTAIAVVRNRP